MGRGLLAEQEQRDLTKSGPKEEPAHPVTEEKKAAWKLRMKRLGINQSELAKQLQVTRAAVSHLFKNAKQSSLVPHVERVLRFGPPAPRGVDPAKWETMDDDERSMAVARSPEFNESRSRESYEGIFGKIRDPHRVDPHDSEGRELVYLFSQLHDVNRQKLVDLARVLHEAQQREVKHNGLILLLDHREKEIFETRRGALEMVSMYQEQFDKLDDDVRRLKEAEEKGEPVPSNAVFATEGRRDAKLVQMGRWQESVDAANRDLEEIMAMKKQAAKLSKLSKKRGDTDDLAALRRALKMPVRKD